MNVNMGLCVCVGANCRHFLKTILSDTAVKTSFMNSCTMILINFKLKIMLLGVHTCSVNLLLYGEAKYT